MKKKSNVLLATGALAFVVGCGAVIGALRGPEAVAAADEGAGAVLVAQEAIPPGTTGEDALERGLVVAREVAADKRAEGALTTTDALAGRVLAMGMAPGQQLTAAALRPPALRAGSITIPAGKQGVAIELPFVAGGGGYVGAGDRVNVYGNVPRGLDGAVVTQLVLQNVEVLDVSTEVAPRVAGGEERAAASVVTYLLALDANEAEHVIYLAANAKLWLGLVGDTVTFPPTSGRHAGDVLP